MVKRSNLILVIKGPLFLTKMKSELSKILISKRNLQNCYKLQRLLRTINKKKKKKVLQFLKITQIRVKVMKLK